MTLVSPSQSAPGDEITADTINGPVNAIAAVVNGQIDDTNISAVSGTKLSNATVTNSKLSTAAGEPGAAWTTFTNTGIAASLGTITSGTTTGKYVKIGKTIHMHLDGTIVSNGTGAGGVFLNLPPGVAAIGSSNFIAYGRADAVSGKQLQGKLDPTNNRIIVFNYDGTYPGTNGEVLRVSLAYEAA